jgi:nucleotide-binding universal stress UspA family protein
MKFFSAFPLFISQSIEAHSLRVINVEDLMRVFQTILCPVDFSEFSLLALRYAKAIRRQYEAKLIVYHAVHTSGPLLDLGTNEANIISQTKKELEGIVHEIFDHDPNIEMIVNVANPTIGILDQAVLNNADLLIMGTHGRTGFEKYLMGSVTNKVLHHAQIPVLVVCHTKRNFFSNHSRPIKIKKILCPVELKQGCLATRNLGFDLAQSYQSHIYFLHVVSPVITYVGSAWEKDAALLEIQKMSPVQEERDRRHHRASLKMRHFLQNYEETWCNIHKLITEGDPAAEILRMIEKHKIELVVMGHHSRMPLVEAVVGSVTHKIITHASCPVLVVRSEK